MKLLLSATAVALLFAAEPALRLAPEAETTVKKTFENGGSLEIVSANMTFTIEDEEHEVEVEDPEGSIEVSQSMTFTDTYGEREGGRFVSLTRTFGKLEDSNMQSFADEDGEVAENTEEGESALTGATVAFTWDPDKEDYKLEFVEDEDDRDESLLEGLLIEADYSFLLPDPELEVQEGDTWEVPALVFDTISSPGGDLKIWADGERDEEQDDFDERFREGLSGSLECEWSEVEEGKAVILLTGEVTTEIVNDVDASEMGDEAPEDLELTNTIQFEFTVKGKLLWDLEKHRAHSFSMEGDLTMTNIFEQSGGEMSLYREEVYEGTYYDRSSFE